MGIHGPSRTIVFFFKLSISKVIALNASIWLMGKPGIILHVLLFYSIALGRELLIFCNVSVVKTIASFTPLLTPEGLNWIIGCE